MSKVNLKQLAKELNLSVSTVSRALSNSHEISQETKEKVKYLAEKLNYQPNPHAMSLRSQKTKTIAVIIPELSNNFFALAIDGIESIMQTAGYQLLIYLSHEDQQKEVSIVNKLEGRVDGVLICMATETHDISHLRGLKEKKIPIVFFDRVSNKLNTVKVITNDIESAYKATEHLIARGAQRIAYISLSLNISVDQKRMQGCLKALEDHQYTGDKKRVLSCTINDEENYQLIKKMLSSPTRPDAIFTCVERLAITTYTVCRDLRLSIPVDVKVVTFSNMPAAALLSPPLTTISQPAYEIGKAAAQAILDALNKNIVELDDEKIILPSILIERAST
ncbi:LacI family transcriptional regulator [Pedobacter aquae]|uniref:LacI family transcriptional regulator n=1 Tax=Pedobacter aquae TaxID=2605747 RepID=A0A5C0VLR8_9SPHI|nr:LacI family DNA-binding transcriptional regulator [Pedobacter aquae]QEK52110.1 LacI family transcriptional regulator [Pedobacter aquae]